MTKTCLCKSPLEITTSDISLCQINKYIVSVIIGSSYNTDLQFVFLNLIICPDCIHVLFFLMAFAFFIVPM